MVQSWKKSQEFNSVRNVPDTWESDDEKWAWRHLVHRVCGVWWRDKPPYKKNTQHDQAREVRL